MPSVGNCIIYDEEPDENRKNKMERDLRFNAKQSGVENPRIVWGDEARRVFRYSSPDVKICGWVDA